MDPAITRARSFNRHDEPTAAGDPAVATAGHGVSNGVFSSGMRPGRSRSMVVMTARAVGMAVAQFIFGGVTHFGNGDIEMKRHAGERMIAVDGALNVVDAHHRYTARARFANRLEAHAFDDVLIGVEQIAGEVLH